MKGVDIIQPPELIWYRLYKPGNTWKEISPTSQGLTVIGNENIALMVRGRTFPTSLPLEGYAFRVSVSDSSGFLSSETIYTDTAAVAFRQFMPGDPLLPGPGQKYTFSIYDELNPSIINTIQTIGYTPPAPPTTEPPTTEPPTPAPIFIMGNIPIWIILVIVLILIVIIGLIS